MSILGWFMFYTVIGSILWNAGFVVLGWVLGENWQVVQQYASVIEYAALAIFVAVVIWFVWRRWKARG